MCNPAWKTGGAYSFQLYSSRRIPLLKWSWYLICKILFLKRTTNKFRRTKDIFCWNYTNERLVNEFYTSFGFWLYNIAKYCITKCNNTCYFEINNLFLNHEYNANLQSFFLLVLYDNQASPFLCPCCVLHSSLLHVFVLKKINSDS